MSCAFCKVNSVSSYGGFPVARKKREMHLKGKKKFRFVANNCSYACSARLYTWPPFPHLIRLFLARAVPSRFWKSGNPVRDALDSKFASHLICNLYATFMPDNNICSDIWLFKDWFINPSSQKFDTDRYKLHNHLLLKI